MSFAADALTQHIPFEIEHRLVSKINIDSDDRLTLPAGPISDYLQTLADDLSQKMQLPDEMKIKVSVVNNEVVNAFATLDGNVVFFTGLLESIPNENTLAMVMAHEIAHIKLRHPLRALGRGVVVGLAMATIAGSSANGIVDEFIGSTGLLTALSFTREQESAADELATAALAAHYGHIGGSRQLFEILSTAHKNAEKGLSNKLPEFFSTHPLSKNRINAIKQQASQNNWALKGKMREIPDTVLSEIERLHENAGEDEKASGI